jgi:hypothetical protein
VKYEIALRIACALLADPLRIGRQEASLADRCKFSNWNLRRVR